MLSRTLAPSRWLLRRRNGLCMHLAAPLARQFSATSSRGVRALFVDTENAQLNEKLKEMQDKIILPAHLPLSQRKLVFDPSKKAMLQRDPIIIEIEDYEHRFTSINKHTERPKVKSSVRDITKLMHSSGDWRNLGTLLAGCQKAAVRFDLRSLARIVNIGAKDARGVYAFLQCAKESQKTGFRLENPTLVVLMAFGINRKIFLSGWDAAETEQATKWMDMLLDLLQWPEHAIREHGVVRRMEYSRVFKGMSLFNSASLIKVKQQAGEPIENDLPQLKDDIVAFKALWAKTLNQDLTIDPEFARLNPLKNQRPEDRDAKKGPPKSDSSALQGGAYVQVLAHGIKVAELASELVGEEAAGLLPIKEALDNHLTQFVGLATGPRPKGWHRMYEQVVGRLPAWADRCDELVPESEGLS